MTQLLNPIDNKADRDTIVEMFNQFNKDALVLEANRTDWIKNYPDCWVVVYDGKLVSHSETMEEALRLADDDRVPRGRLVLEYLTTSPRTMIL